MSTSMGNVACRCQGCKAMSELGIKALQQINNVHQVMGDSHMKK